MADHTGIEWTDATWNPIRGCTRVSEGCRNCYAETVAGRFSGPGLPYEGLTRLDAKGNRVWTGKVSFIEGALTQPLRWKRPRRIFVNSMSDLFHEHVPDEWIDRIFAVMGDAPQHTFQILTKRPKRMRQYLTTRKSAKPVMVAMGDGTLGYHPFNNEVKSPANIWLGVSVEDQATADERIPLLLQTQAAKRFISAEPLLGPLELEPWLEWPSPLVEMPNGDAWGCIECEPTDNCQKCPFDKAVQIVEEGPKSTDGMPEWVTSERRTLDWIICGGESGPNARPIHPDWARSLRDQCAAAGVPFFFKQWGEWEPRDAWWHDAPMVAIKHDGSRVPDDVNPDDVGGARMARTGKRAAGSLLDGREHKEFPA